MTAILAMFANDGHTADEGLVTRMLGRMGSRGGARASVWREGGVVIAISRHEWEFGPGFSGPVLIVQDGDHVIAADASLYYRDDLRRKLAAKGVRPKGQTPSHLILAAYQAFGEKCPEMLEGDFSFVIWDRKARKVFCSRDYSGQRPLFYAELGSTLIAASTIGAIVEHPQSTAELNLPSIALDAAGLIYSGSLETCYHGVFTCQAGSSLSRTADAPVRVIRWWNPTKTEPSHSSSTDEAAEELVRLLGLAVQQRTDSAGPTSIWLSGGWDSTAVFAAGQKVLTQRDESDRLRAVSVSFPLGDSGRDDERIEAVGRMWNVPINWVNIADVPLFDRSIQQRYTRRDEPYTHLYQQLVRATARASRGVDSHVALNGHGGDFLFQVSPVYLADLLGRGRFLQLARDWKSMRVRAGRARLFFHWVVQPLLPDILLALAARIRGRHLRGHFERTLPVWIHAPFAQSHGLADLARAGSPRTRQGSRAAFETYWYLTHPLFARFNSFVAGYALEEGVETRAPLYDRRVIEFALSRPIAERNSGGEHKLLVRRAMRDLLPSEVLAPRPVKTGTLAGYLSTSMRAAGPLLKETLRSPKLGELGIVDIGALQRTVDAHLCGGSNGYTSAQLFAAVQAELWLRGELGEATCERGKTVSCPTGLKQPVMAGNRV